MPDMDYGKLGFRCGLEIHQRLATKEKLFCSCSAMLPEDIPVAEVDRRQRAVAGELGRIDPSAEFEASRSRKFVYNAFRKTSCLVELDEEPPHELNKEALGISLLIAASLNANVPSEFEPMRKEVVDGSDTSAFQRTLLIGYDGSLGFGKRGIGITAIFLEEESSGIDYGDNSMVVYNLDRLGIPLVEIDTKPEIHSPKEAKEVARRLGLILRLTGRVQRGIGSIRQDVNVSIKEGARVEIKGFQELETMDKIIENEVLRQVNLIEIRKVLQERSAGVHAHVDVTGVFKDTHVKLIKKSADSNGVVLAVRLGGFAGLLGREINPDRRLGSEISDYAKFAGVGGIMHSDENLGSYGFDEKEIKELREKLKADEGDAFFLVTGPEHTCMKAIRFANKRAEEAIHGVPNETRGVDSKRLITTFLRPLPGGARMYPETDVRPIALDPEKYREIVKEKVDAESTVARLERTIGNRQLAEQMPWSPYLDLFWQITEKTGVNGSVVAPVLLEKLTQARRMGVAIERINDETMLYIFELYKKGEITKAGIEEIIKQAPFDKKGVENAIKRAGLRRISGSALKKIAGQARKGKSREEAIREVMSKHRLNVDAEELGGLV